MLLRVFGSLTAISLALCLVWWTALGSAESSALSMAPLGLIVFGTAAVGPVAFRVVAWRTDKRTTIVAHAHPDVEIHQFMADTRAVLVLRRLGSEGVGRRLRSLNGAYVTVVLDNGSLWIYAGATAWLAARVDLTRVVLVEPAQISTTRGGWWPGIRFQITDGVEPTLLLDVLPFMVAHGSLRKSSDVAGDLASIRKELETGAAI